MLILSVAVGIIYNSEGQVLLAERPTDKPLAGYWEFPGGKLEPGETPQHALYRELHEELGITVRTAYPWITRQTIQAAPVKLHFFKVTAWSGTYHGKEGQALCWQPPHAITANPLLPANHAILQALSLPAVYAISNIQSLGLEKFLAQLQKAVRNGLRLLQLREKNRSLAELATWVDILRTHTAPYPLRILVNGSADLDHALLAADGIHLPSTELLKLQSRPDVALCAASCHNRQELEHAAKIGVDCVVLSPVLPTRSHPNAQTLGWDTFAAYIHDYPLPVYALGGMQLNQLTTAWQHGAQGISLLRDIWEN